MTTHIGFLDADPVRLVTPLLDEAIESEEAIFIGTDEHRYIFDRIKIVLDARNIKTTFYLLPDVASMAEVRKRINIMAKELSTAKKEVVFNASCGPRHRLLVAYEVFRKMGYPIFVVEPYSDQMCWLYPESQEHQVHDCITLADYLAIFGARSEFVDNPFPQHLDNKLTLLGKKWAKNALELGPGLATLNYLATTCRKEQTLEVTLSEKQQGYRELGMLIDDLTSIGLAKYNAGILIFAHEEARRFANGEWLETYVNGVVRELQYKLPTLQDFSQGIQVYRKTGNQDVRNELDVSCIVNNKLHIIECKTKGMGQDGDDTLYKLESLRDLLGGLQARAMLISFRPLRYYDINRAADLGLAIIGPEKLGELDMHLYNWFLCAGGKIKMDV